MVSLNTHDREIIRKLFSSKDDINLFEIHAEKKLSPGQIAATLNWMEQAELIEIDGLRVRLSRQGRDWILRNRRAIFMNITRSWAKPTKCLPEALNFRVPYMPKLSSIDQNFFRKRG